MTSAAKTSPRVRSKATTVSIWPNHLTVPSPVAPAHSSSPLLSFEGAILAYGQTGSGKTHSMIGGADADKRGLIPRIMEAIMSTAAGDAQCSCKFTLVLVEVYKERIR